MSDPNIQDWTPVVFKRKPVVGTAQQRLNQAQRDGLQIEAIRKPAGGRNKQQATVQVKEDEDGVIVPKVSHSVSQQISTARAEKGWTRKELAQKLNVKEAIITEYETAKAVPEPRLLQRMRQLLSAPLK